MFGNGKTALKVSLGKYLEGASVSNMAYNSNPALRIPFGGGLCSGFGGIGNPCVSRGWFDANFNNTPDCVLTNPLANGECGPIDNLQFGSNQPSWCAGSIRNCSPGGAGVRPTGHSVCRCSRSSSLAPRWKSGTTGGPSRCSRRRYDRRTTSPISPSDIASYTITAPRDPRLPGGGGYTIGPLYDINPNVFGQSDLLVQSTKKVGDDTRLFNGVDATFNVRNVKGVTFQGGTSTGKVTNDFCDIRSAVPEATVGFGTSLLTMPFCHQESPWQTSFNGLVDVYDSAHRRERQLGLPGQAEHRDRPARLAGRQLHADGGGPGGCGRADWPSADSAGPAQVNLLAPGQ